MSNSKYYGKYGGENRRRSVDWNRRTSYRERLPQDRSTYQVSRHNNNNNNMYKNGVTRHPVESTRKRQYRAQPSYHRQYREQPSYHRQYHEQPSYHSPPLKHEVERQPDVEDQHISKDDVDRFDLDGFMRTVDDILTEDVDTEDKCTCPVHSHLNSYDPEYPYSIVDDREYDPYDPEYP
jgi:hypothetical protein